MTLVEHTRRRRRQRSRRPPTFRLIMKDTPSTRRREGVFFMINCEGWYAEQVIEWRGRALPGECRCRRVA